MIAKPVRCTRPSFLGGDPAAAPGDLDQDEHDAAAIKHGQGQDVDHGQVEAEKRGEFDQAQPTGALDDLVRGAGQADGAADRDGVAAGDPGANADCVRA